MRSECIAADIARSTHTSVSFSFGSAWQQPCALRLLRGDASVLRAAFMALPPASPRASVGASGGWASHQLKVPPDLFKRRSLARPIQTPSPRESGRSARRSTPARRGPLAPLRRRPCATADTLTWSSRTGCSRRTGQSLGGIRACRAADGT
jgi:hypothetical protein